jgi:hypothetical protein
VRWWRRKPKLLAGPVTARDNGDCLIIETGARFSMLAYPSPVPSDPRALRRYYTYRVNIVWSAELIEALYPLVELRHRELMQGPEPLGGESVG